MQIANDHVVSIHYHLTDADGTVLDSSLQRQPLAYLHGHGNLIAGLERALLGRGIGDEFTTVIAAADAYGAHDPELVVAANREQFPADASLEPGMRFQASGPQGQTIAVITAIEGDTVTVDTNHPLAGMDLTFAVEVVDIREATPAEIDHGHIHMGAGCCGGEHHGDCKGH